MKRIKFTLEDGRKIYHGGTISFRSRYGKREYISHKIFHFPDGHVPGFSEGTYGAFDPHLCAYYSPLAMETLSLRPIVRVVDMVVEDTSAPLDGEAFVIGGCRAASPIEAKA